MKSQTTYITNTKELVRTAKQSGFAPSVDFGDATKSRAKRASPKFTAGFTLIEMLIVISIIVIVGGIGLFFGFDTLRGYSFHSDRDVLVSALQHARAEAISNICRGKEIDCTGGGKPQGVYIDTDHSKFIIFQTETNSPTYSGRPSEDTDQDVSIDFNPSTNYSFSNFPTAENVIIFSQLSGNTACSYSSTCNITITNTSKTDTIHINSEGAITWDH